MVAAGAESDPLPLLGRAIGLVTEELTNGDGAVERQNDGEFPQLIVITALYHNSNQSQASSNVGTEVAHFLRSAGELSLRVLALGRGETTGGGPLGFPAPLGEAGSLCKGGKG